MVNIHVIFNVLVNDLKNETIIYTHPSMTNKTVAQCYTVTNSVELSSF